LIFVAARRGCAYSNGLGIDPNSDESPEKSDVAPIDLAAGGHVDGSASRFPPTRWTLVHRAGGADDVGRPIAIAELVRLYTPALLAHLRRAMHDDQHRAEDLLQGFLADKVLEQRLIGYADPNRGRFRTFLLTALDRYVIDEHRRASAQKRSPAGSVEDIDAHLESLSRSDEVNQRASAFDRAWAQEVVNEVVASMRTQCEADGRGDLWDVFCARYLRPATDGVAPEPHDSIAARLKLESAHQAGNLLITAKRMFTRCFKSIVARYAVSETELREEVSELWRIYSRG
jgi:DNA-directed RNA polymerase specialized sigma24 family protein